MWQLAIILLLLLNLLPAQDNAFHKFFNDATLRVDYYHSGDAEQDLISIDKMYRLDGWAGNPNQLIDPFNNGKYYLQVYDVASNRLIYSRGFNSAFGEYQTTDPARKGQLRVFHESVLLPCPKGRIRLVLQKRDRQNILQPAFTTTIDPADYHIIKERPSASCRPIKILNNGDPQHRVDLVILSEGYSAADYDQFEKDARATAERLFSLQPYKRNRAKFNLTALFSPSTDSGVDEPRQGSYKNSVLNASFNAFDLPRYLLTEDNKALRDLAGAVPYDAILVLVNSSRYGGGGIYNQYAISTARNALSAKVIVHEFGHSFAGLGDEYYTSSTAYNDFYPAGVEPTEPNITALLGDHFLKWPNQVDAGRAVPTDWHKTRYDSLGRALRNLHNEQRTVLDSLRKSGAATDTLEQTRSRYQARADQLKQQIQNFWRDHPLKGKTGFFEGAGYSSSGLYRPMLQCLMFSNDQDEFCRVCRQAIQRMIDFYTED